MHVVIVSDYAEVNGGAARVSIESARALAMRGVRVTYFCGTGPVSPALSHPLIELRHLGLQDVWSTKGKARAFAQSIWNETARRALNACLRTAGPDTVVHVHQWTRCLSPSVFAALDRVPWAVSLHDYFYFCPTGLLYVSSRQQPCDRRPMSASCLACNCDPRGAVFKAVRVARHLAASLALARSRDHGSFVHVSEFAMNVARPHLPARARHFLVPNPGGELSKPRVDVRRNRAFVFVGRLQREKGVLDFAEAARSAGVPALFLGDGPADREIRDIYPSAVVSPWGGKDIVERTLKEARCLVLPSRWNETFGLTVVEAQAVGVPAIAARNSGAAEVVASSRGGILVRSADVRELADAIKRLAADDELAAQLGRQAYRAYATGYWASEAYGERLMACYGSMLHRSCPGESADSTPTVACDLT